jgi:hypothetical protein
MRRGVVVPLIPIIRDHEPNNKNSRPTTERRPLPGRILIAYFSFSLLTNSERSLYYLAMLSTEQTELSEALP